MDRLRLPTFSSDERLVWGPHLLADLQGDPNARAIEDYRGYRIVATSDKKRWSAKVAPLGPGAGRVAIQPVARKLESAADAIQAAKSQINLLLRGAEA